MIAPTFLEVSETSGCTLADLSVTGYDEPVYDEDMEATTGGCLGSFSIQLLNTSGATEAKYYWVDDGNGHKGWYATPNGKAIDGGAASIELPAGQSLWTIGAGLRLVTAGQVNENDILKQTTSAGAVAIGNATPVDLTLAKLLVEGYEDPVYDEDMEATTGGCLGSFSVQFLTTSGATEAKYYWVDDGNGHKGWYATPNAKAIEGGASSISLPAGQGLWVIGGGLYLRVPAPEL